MANPIYATKTVRDSLQRSINDLKETMANPVAWAPITNKQQFVNRLKDEEKRLAAVTPPAIKDDTERKALQEREALLRTSLRGGRERMNTRAEMEVAPAGAPGRELVWQNYWKDHTVAPNGDHVRVDRKTTRGAISEWKDTQRTLNADREEFDPDVANLETIRPDPAHVSLAESRLPRSFGATSVATTQEQYNAAFPTHEPTFVERMLGKDGKEE